MSRSYNPLSVDELGRNAVRALLSYDTAPLPPVPPFEGGGVYTLYYEGDSFAPYAALGEKPIYVGRAAAKLHGRLLDHESSIDQAENLSVDDFRCRWLILEPVWINLTERILIDRFNPLWNRTIKGFGNHHQGKSRTQQARSPWDTLHPGRYWATDMQDCKESVSDLLRLIGERK